MGLLAPVLLLKVVLLESGVLFTVVFFEVHRAAHGGTIGVRHVVHDHVAGVHRAAHGLAAGVFHAAHGRAAGVRRADGAAGACFACCVRAAGAHRAAH
eukprot:192973-Pyramimonas_sp.AAC.1